MLKRFLVVAEGEINLADVINQDGAVKAVLVRAQMGVETGKPADTELDCILMAALKVADHGKAVAIEDRMKVEVVFRHFGFLQRSESALQIFFTPGQVARLLISRIKHGNDVERISAHRRSFL